MQTQQLTWNTEPAVEIEIQTAHNFISEKTHRTVRISISSPPRREPCGTSRTALATLRQAELAEWQASGGDHLCGVHQPIN